MKICSKCKTEYDDTKEFCRKDGNRLNRLLSPEANAKIRLYQSRIANSPDDGHLHLEYAKYLVVIESYEEALIELAMAQELGANLSEVRKTFVDTYTKIPDWNSVAIYLELLLDETPYDIQYNKDLFNAYLRGGHPEEALKQIALIIQKYSKDEDVLRWSLAEALNLQSPETICSICKHVVEIQPKDPDVWGILAKNLEKAGQTQESFYAWERLLELVPHNGCANFHVGVCRFVAALEAGVDSWDELGAMFDIALTSDHLTQVEAHGARLFLACAHIMGDQYDQRHLDVLEQESNSSGEIGIKVAITSYLQLTNNMLVKQRAEDGLRFAHKARELHDNDETRELLTRAYIAVADLKLHERKWTEALSYYNKASVFLPHDHLISEKRKIALSRIRWRKHCFAAFTTITVAVSLFAVLFYFEGLQSFKIDIDEGADVQIEQFGRIVFRGKGSQEDTGLLRTGPYSIHITKPGYYPVRQHIWATFGKNPRLLQFRLEPAFGTLRIDSDPQSAEVFIDGQAKGTTPLEIEKLTALPHIVEVRKAEKGFYLAKAEITPDSVLDLGVVNLGSNFGALRIDTRPSNAKVLIDNREVGVTPVAVGGIIPGEHHVIVDGSCASLSGSTIEAIADPRSKLLNKEMSVEIGAGEIHDLGVIDVIETFVGKYVGADFNDLQEDRDGTLYAAGSISDNSLILAHIDYRGNVLDSYRERSAKARTSIKKITTNKKESVAALSCVSTNRILWFAAGSNPSTISPPVRNIPLYLQPKYGSVLEFDQSDNLLLATIGRDANIECRNLEGRVVWWTPLFVGANSKEKITTHIVSQQDGNLLVAGHTGEMSQGPRLTPFLCQYDSLGRLQWQREYQSITENVQDTEILAVHKTANKILICGSTDEAAFIDSKPPTLWFVVADEKGETISQAQTDLGDADPYVSRSIFLDNGRTVHAGIINLKEKTPGQQNQQYLALLCADMNGKVIWKNQTKITSVRNIFVTDMIACFDGGIYVMLRIERFESPNETWLIKTNSEGIFDDTQINANHQLHVFGEKVEKDGIVESSPLVGGEMSSVHGIHAASFKGEGNYRKAMDFQRHLQNEYGYTSRIFKSEDGAHLGVLITGFVTKNAAEEALQEIQRRTGIADLYVRTLEVDRFVESSSDTEEHQSGSGTVNADILNVRSRPSLESDVIKKLKNGTHVRIDQRNGEWLYIDAGTDTHGWVHQDYIIIDVLETNF